MKLERSTYVKIALIVLLCLGVCGFFGGCGRGVVVAPLGSLLAPGGCGLCGLELPWARSPDMREMRSARWPDMRVMPRARWRMRRCTAVCAAALHRLPRAVISKSTPVR